MSQDQLKGFFEIFKEVDKAKGKDAKKQILHANSNKTLKTFLDYVFNPNIKWLIPDGVPPYEVSKEDPNLLRSRIYQDFRLLQHCTTVGPYKDMKPIKRENMFISLLQTLHPEEAELLIYVKDNRALPYKTVTKSLIKEAFPIFTQNWGD